MVTRTCDPNTIIEFDVGANICGNLKLYYGIRVAGPSYYVSNGSLFNYIISRDGSLKTDATCACLNIEQ